MVWRVEGAASRIEGAVSRIEGAVSRQPGHLGESQQKRDPPATVRYSRDTGGQPLRVLQQRHGISTGLASHCVRYNRSRKATQPLRVCRAAEQAAADAATQRTADIAARRVAAAAALPAEAAAVGGATALLRLRLPSGATAQRRFAAEAAIDDVYTWVDSLEGFEVWEYVLSCSFPRREFARGEAVTLSAGGLVPNAALMVLSRDD